MTNYNFETLILLALQILFLIGYLSFQNEVLKMSCFILVFLMVILIFSITLMEKLERRWKK